MKTNINIILLFIIILTISSCVSLKKSIYLQGDMAKELKDVESTYDIELKAYLIKPNDNLYIRVTSVEPKSSSFLNNESGITTRIESPIAASLAGHRVQLDGSINFPYIGKLYVAGLTIDEVKTKIQLAVSKFVTESNVTVKLLNDNITIIGEVRAPGRFPLYDEQINIFDALSMAGDVTDFANRKKIKLLRKEGDIQQIITINALDENILFSPYYYIQPGDIIYVQPQRLKSWSLSNITFGLSFTVLNTVLLFFTLLNQNQN